MERLTFDTRVGGRFAAAGRPGLDPAMKRPALDLACCTRCDGCIEVCPEVFVLTDAGYVHVRDLPTYPEAEVDEAIKYCPDDCIQWESV